MHEENVTYIHTHTMEYYSAMNKETAQFVTTWMDPEGIMLSEISHREKDKYDLICRI